MSRSPLRQTSGPFYAEQLKTGDSYELANGHPIECLPAGSRHAKSNLVGGLALETDPEVESAGVDAGYAFTAQDLRAPDIAVGNVPDEPGWINGVPPLAVEYADTGQNEKDLQDKIADLLHAGTRYIWVVRLRGPRRVEVYESGKKPRTVTQGQHLSAPGVLKNPLPVEALYDPQAAHEVALRNLLQRRGYADLDAVRNESRQEGKAEGKLEGRAEGKLEGRAEGKLEGKAEGKLEGKAEGKLEGKAEAERAMVLRLLHRRLGALPANLEARIPGLTSEQLGALAEAVLDFQEEADLTAWLDGLLNP